MADWAVCDDTKFAGHEFLLVVLLKRQTVSGTGFKLGIGSQINEQRQLR
jgi:hypothetical protein